MPVSLAKDAQHTCSSVVVPWENEDCSPTALPFGSSKDATIVELECCYLVSDVVLDDYF